MLLLVAAAVASPLLAQTEATPPETAAQPSPAVALSEKKDLISVDFPNEEIRTILRNVADLFELNLVVPETLQGRTSIKLRNVTWRQIFREVLSPIGYTVLEDENIIRVVSRDALAAEPTTTEVIVLNYSRASDILPTISSMVDTSDLVKGKIVVDQRGNALVITERPSRLEKIKPIIARLDIATAQVMIETKFVDVSRSFGRDLGLNWASLGGDGLKVGSSGISATPAKLTKYGEAPTATTYKTKEVTDSAGNTTRVWDTDPNGDKIVDKQGTQRTADTFQSGTITDDVFNSVNSLLNAPSLNTGVFTASDFSLVLKAMQSDGDIRLVSNPTLVTLNNVEAMVNVGDEYPIPNYTYNQERGAFEVAGFTFRPLGVVMKVTPQVNAANFITLAVEPEVSFQNGSVPFGTADIPIINVKKTKTKVTLKSGHTMGIGGLISLDTKSNNTKVPFLGEIPVLGNLFKSKGKSETRKNLVIFITAKTLDNEGAKIEDVFDPRVIRSMGIKQEDLPGYRTGEAAFSPTSDVPAKQ
ncbi:MAG: hypothetical protein IPL39_17130 [Opitutaceae bacterium]|nr:hypothetical protein [Opitutaceae bacterium]